MDLLSFANYDYLKDALYKWAASAMQTDNNGKENKWTQSIAVGSKTFVEKMKEALDNFMGPLLPHNTRISQLRN